MHEFNEAEEIRQINFSVWKKLFKVILKSRKHVIIAVVFASTIALLEALIPVLHTYAIETFIEQNNHSTLTAYIILSIIFAVVFGVVIFGFIYAAGIIETEVSYQLRKEAFYTLQKLPFAFYDKTPQGWIMARMTSDARRLSQVISWGLIDLVWSALVMIFTMVILYIYSWQLALIVTASLPLMFLIAIVFRKRVLLQHRKARFYNSELTAQYNESFLGAKTTKSLVVEDLNAQEFDASAQLMRKTSIRANSLSAIFSVTLLTICYFIVALVAYSGTYLAIEDILVVSTLYLFIRATVQFFDPVIVLTQFVSQLQQAQASAERVLSLIETVPEIDDENDVKEVYGDLFNHKKEAWEPIVGNIEFKDVSFYYNEGEVILDKFNLKIDAGMRVAFVGHTGSGKTTLVNLISRFYEPKEGQILIDGKDYKQRSLAWLHKRLGYVLQSPSLFSTTIRENIRYGRLTATDEEVIQAAQSIGIHDFILKLEHGYDTQVGEGGNLLSLGQKQLISFARAIIADPRILILDEATSSIDSEAERLIQEATQTLLKGRTSFMVAHRLSTIVDSDLIVMLEMGKIIEMGTHEDLLEKRGAYFELYKNQFFQEKQQQYDANLNI